ncbi:hypothetical protein FISHEDRAFT_7890, partial [Fistulina hepatica ATCC 64428]
LTQRPLDMLYFVFFVWHFFISVFFDFQPLYPRALIPGPLANFFDWYLRESRDFFMANMDGRVHNMDLTWFQCFSVFEVIWQAPSFVIAMLGLYNDAKGVYPLIAAYGASTFMTIVPCVVQFLVTPIITEEEFTRGVLGFTTPEQQSMCVWSYVFPMVMCFVLAVDMSYRL